MLEAGTEMKKMANNSKEKTFWGLLGAGASAVVASVCCVGPLVLLALGVSGAWISYITTLAPYRPIFVAITLIFLGFAFYRIYRNSKSESCSVERPCAYPGTKRTYKTTLWIALIVILGLLLFPYLVPFLFAQSGMEKGIQTEQVVLEVKNMFCATCAATLKKSLTRLEGVKEAKVTLKPPEAVVVFDPSKVKVEDSISATTQAGFPSSAK